MKVILVAAVTICGRLSTGGQASTPDRHRLEDLRDKTQASIMGANTLRLDNPEMRGINRSFPPDRIRAIISQSGSVPTAGKKLFAHGPRPVVFTSRENTPVLREKLLTKAEVVPLPAGLYGLSIQAALDYLAAEGADSVLIEGGGRLNYSVLAQGLVDEIFLTIKPFVSGDSTSSTFADGPYPLCHPFLTLEMQEYELAPNGEIFLQYRIKK